MKRKHDPEHQRMLRERAKAAGHTATVEMPFDYRVVFTMRRDGLLDIAWHPRRPQYAATPAALERIDAAYAIAQNQFLTEVAAIIGRGVVCTDPGPSGGEPTTTYVKPPKKN